MTRHAWHALRSLAATTFMAFVTSCASLAAPRQSIAAGPNLADCSNLIGEATTLTLAFSDTNPSRAATAQAAYAAKLADYHLCLVQRARDSS